MRLLDIFGSKKLDESQQRRKALKAIMQQCIAAASKAEAIRLTFSSVNVDTMTDQEVNEVLKQAKEVFKK